MFQSLDTTQSQLQVLYAKQGRAQQFTTQAARDNYLFGEIKALKAYEKDQQKRAETLGKDVESAKSHLNEVGKRSSELARNDEERRENLGKMGEEVSSLKSKLDGMQEQRK